MHLVHLLGTFLEDVAPGCGGGKKGEGKEQEEGREGLLAR